MHTLSSAKNVIMKWGIYSIEDRTISVEQMCDRALLAARSIKGQYGKYFAAYDDQLRNQLLREQAITDGMLKGSSSFTCSRNIASRTTGWPAPRRWFAGTIRNGGCSRLRNSFLCSRKTDLSPGSINTSGTGSVPFCGNGTIKDTRRFLFPSMCPGRTFTTRIWWTSRNYGECLYRKSEADYRYGQPSAQGWLYCGNG